MICIKDTIFSFEILIFQSDLYMSLCLIYETFTIVDVTRG